MDDLINKQSDIENDLQTTYDLVTAIGTGSYGSKGALLTALFDRARKERSNQEKY